MKTEKNKILVPIPSKQLEDKIKLIGGKNSITSIDMSEGNEVWNDGWVTIKWIINGEEDGVCIHKDRVLEAIFSCYKTPPPVV